METKEQVEKLFRKELKELLHKWGAELLTEDSGHWNKEYNVMSVYIPDVPGRRQGAYIDLGTCVGGKGV